MSARLGAIAMTAALLIIPSTSIAAIIHVPGDEGTIQEGIDAAAPGDTVAVEPNTYEGALNRDLDFGGKNLVLLSDPLRVPPVIDCGGAGRGFYFHSGEDTSSVIQGFVVVNAAADSGAGAYCVNGSSPKFTSCIFQGNAATTRGGGIACVKSSPVVAHCRFEGNVVSGATFAYGGAMACIDQSVPRIADCDFVGNTSDGLGGAIYLNHESTPLITGCTFESNSVAPTGSGGGAIYGGSSSAGTITGCTFTGNSGPVGGAVYTQNSRLTMTDCAFIGNDATYQGAAVRFLYATSDGTLDNCTFAGNTSECYGGTIAFVLDADAVVTNCTLVGGEARSDAGGIFIKDASPTVENTIIAFCGANGAVSCVDGTEAPAFDDCVLFGNACGDTLCGAVGDTMVRDPRFCGVVTGDYTLCSNSPCVAANNPWLELVGAEDVGCGDCDSPVARASWSVIKAMYR